MGEMGLSHNIFERFFMLTIVKIILACIALHTNAEIEAKQLELKIDTLLELLFSLFKFLR